MPLPPMIRPALTDVITHFPATCFASHRSTHVPSYIMAPYIVPLIIHHQSPTALSVIIPLQFRFLPCRRTIYRCLHHCCSLFPSTFSSSSAMSFRPRRSPPPIPDSASSPTSPSRRPVDGCATSTPSPLPSPMTCSGGAPAPSLGSAGRCVASTLKHSPVPPFTTRLPPKCSPGSRLRKSSPRTTAYVISVVAGTPAAGPVRYVSHLAPTTFPFP